MERAVSELRCERPIRREWGGDGMRDWLTRRQLDLMRVIGMRKLREAIEAKSDTVQADLMSRLDALRGEMADRDRALDRCLDSIQRGLGEQQLTLGTLMSDEGGRGQFAYERGEALDARVAQIEGLLAKLVASVRADVLERALGDIRVEMSSLRADFAREAEMMSERGDSRSKFVERNAPFS